VVAGSTATATDWSVVTGTGIDSANIHPFSYFHRLPFYPADETQVCVARPSRTSRWRHVQAFSESARRAFELLSSEEDARELARVEGLAARVRGVGREVVAVTGVGFVSASWPRSWPIR